MAKYTKEQVRTIIRGLATGSAHRRIPISDAEFERLYDPAAYEHKELIPLLKDLTQAIRELGERPTRPERPYTTAPTPSAKGPVEL